MEVLIIGDIFSSKGRDIAHKYILNNKKKYDLIIVNGENSASGFGITTKIAEEFFRLGVDVITLGNHTYDKKDIYEYLDKQDRIIRPANFSPLAPGKGYVVIQKNNLNICVMNLQGRVYMNAIDDPFSKAYEIYEKLKDKVDIFICDFHAEATSEKKAMGYHLLNKAQIVFGTHTHVQTSDDRIIDNFTAYITDVGMTGPHDSILGVKKEIIIKKFKDNLPARFEPSEDGIRLNGIVVTIDEINKVATSIKRLDIALEEI